MSRIIGPFQTVRRLTVTLYLAVALGLLLNAGLMVAQTAQWHQFGTASDGFHAQFPIAPQVSKNCVPVNGDNFELRSYEAAQGSTALYVGVCDYGVKGAAAVPAAMLDSASKGAVDHMSAHILSSKRIVLGTYPGLEFQAENDKLHFTARMYMAGGVLYQIMVATPLAETYAGTAQFLDSFEIVAASGPATPPATQTAVTDWTAYTYAEDGFKASFPLKPALEKQNVTTAVGPVDLKTYSTQNSAGALIAAVCDYGAVAIGKDPDAVLADARKGAVSNINGKLISESKITLGANHGLAFEADSESAHVSARTWLVGTRLYQMIVVSPLNTPDPEAAQFFASFQLLQP